MFGLTVGLLALVAAVSAAILRGQRTMFLVQYLFFLRYPIMFGLGLALGPLIAVHQDMVGNLFVLDAVGIAIVIAFGAAFGSSVLYMFGLLLGLSRERVRLPLFRAALVDAARPDRQDACVAWIDRNHGRLVLVLLAPLGCVLVVCTPGATWMALVAAAIGILTVSGVRRLASRPGQTSGQDLMGMLAGLVIRGMQKTYDVPDPSADDAPPGAPNVRAQHDGFVDNAGHFMDQHARAMVFLLLSLLLYVAGYFILRASFRGDGDLVAAVPALAYVLILSLMLGLLFSGLAFYFDKYRIPPVLPLLLVWFFSYSFFARDHFFPLVSHAAAASPSQADRDVVQSKPCSLPPEVAFRAWRNQQPTQRPTMVLVAASGGGITASMWSAKVLTEISREGSGLGPDFARSISLISSASGGGVGAAYFIDAFKAAAPHVPSEADLARVMAAAGASSLNETAYAIAYNDFPALLFPLLVTENSPDRGWALEHVWRHRMTNPGATLSSWRTGIVQGWRPTQIFNATIAESGERLLLSAVDCPTATCADSATWRARSFPDLKARGDMEVVTAARLSATFPWVTPLSRQPGTERGYHIADGGYYDNFGITTALEWLSRLQARLPLRDLIEKVILIEIRASPTQQQVEPQANSGWLYATLGPLVTMLNVRSTSQRNHNEAALAALKALLDQPGQDLPFERVSFELSFDSPLSWHLSRAEGQAIQDVWSTEDIVKPRRKLECLWRNPPKLWVDVCGASPPADLSRRDAAAVVFEQARKEAAKPPAKVQSKDKKL